MRIIGQPIAMRKVYEIYNKSNTQDIVLANTPDMELIKAVYDFGCKHGYLATLDAYMISKSTYYNYVKYYKRCLLSGIEHNFKSTKPNTFRKSNWDKKTVVFICKLRKERPNIGKSKLKPYVDKFCKENKLKHISTGTIQNIINSFPNKLRTHGAKKIIQHRKNVVRKPNGYKPIIAGECQSLDSIEFRKGSEKAYIVTCLDEVTKLLYAKATYSHSSMSAKYILQEAEEYLPFDNVRYILTDNGSEFMKNFAKYVESIGITHYHTYPKSPKQNACCERVNRTIQDEFMIRYQDLLFNDLNAFNKQLEKYLRWYNFERVHGTFENKMTPYQKFKIGRAHV